MAFVDVCVHNVKLAVKIDRIPGGQPYINVVRASTHEAYIGMTLVEAERLQEELFQATLELRSPRVTSPAEASDDKEGAS